MPTGSWQHIAVTLSGGIGTMYLNGVQVGTNINMTVQALRHWAVLPRTGLAGLSTLTHTTMV